MRRRRHAFTLTDLLATTASVAILLTLTAATLADDEPTEKQLQNITQLRGLHQGLVTYGNSNKEFFPGLDNRGNILENGPDTGTSGDGSTAEARFWIMLSEQYVTPEYVLSPMEDIWQNAWDPQPNEITPVTYQNYSYAMLDLNMNAPGRMAEWMINMNPKAIQVSDRNCSDLNEQEPFSIWNDEAWHGAALWSDNHVTFAESQVFETRYGNGELNVDANGDPIDDLFTIDTESGSEAYMTFSRDEDGNERAVPRVVEDENE